MQQPNDPDLFKVTLRRFTGNQKPARNILLPGRKHKAARGQPAMKQEIPVAQVLAQLTIAGLPRQPKLTDREPTQAERELPGILSLSGQIIAYHRLRGRETADRIQRPDDQREAEIIPPQPVPAEITRAPLRVAGIIQLLPVPAVAEVAEVAAAAAVAAVVLHRQVAEAGVAGNFLLIQIL